MTALTLVHVVLSLAGIGSGFIVVFGLIAAKRLDGLTALFLASTVATSLTGFFSALRPSSHWSLALDLRSKCRNWAVSECFRLGSTGFPKGAGPESNGSDTV